MLRGRGHQMAVSTGWMWSQHSWRRFPQTSKEATEWPWRKRPPAWTRVVGGGGEDGQMGEIFWRVHGLRCEVDERKIKLPFGCLRARGSGRRGPQPSLLLLIPRTPSALLSHHSFPFSPTHPTPAQSTSFHPRYSKTGLSSPLYQLCPSGHG